MLNLDSQDLNNKRVIIRVDLNVPIDGNDNVTDTTRIEACKETIDLILKLGGSCVLISHLGRPKGKDESLSLTKIVKTCSKVFNQPVLFCKDCIGKNAEQSTANLKPGEIILMENLRFYDNETKGDLTFAKQLSRLGDVYVNDAFGTCHRDRKSVV